MGSRHDRTKERLRSLFTSKQFDPVKQKEVERNGKKLELQGNPSRANMSRPATETRRADDVRHQKTREDGNDEVCERTRGLVCFIPIMTVWRRWGQPHTLPTVSPGDFRTVQSATREMSTVSPELQRVGQLLSLHKRATETCG